MGRFRHDWPISKINASIKLRNAVRYWIDIAAYRRGDLARFDRMVDSHGSTFPGVNAGEWERRIRVTAQDDTVRLHFRERCDRLLRTMDK